MITPPVSVVMPVHNALPYLDEAIRSIISQTLCNFEFVILDDGSTDGSDAVLRAWSERDTRIWLVKSAGRLGPAASSNKVVAQARAPLIARVDADDISHPDRLRRQVEVLTSNPDAALVATLHETIDSNGTRVRHADRARLFRKSSFAPFCHGSIMFRQAAFDAAGGYGKGDYWEDIDFYLRMSTTGRILVIPEPLYAHRLSSTSTRLTSSREAVIDAYADMYRRLGLSPHKGTPRGKARGLAEKIPPPAFALLGSPEVWAGRSPHLLGTLIKRGRLSPNLESACALAWTAWAQISPRSLRLLLRANLGVRNALFGRNAVGLPWLGWDPGSTHCPAPVGVDPVGSNRHYSEPAGAQSPNDAPPCAEMLALAAVSPEIVDVDDDTRDIVKGDMG